VVKGLGRGQKKGGEARKEEDPLKRRGGKLKSNLSDYGGTKEEEGIKQGGGGII